MNATDLSLEGSIEGPLGDAEPAVRRWRDQAAQAALNFSLAIDGGRFSLLAPESPIHTASLGDDPARAIESRLLALLELFPPAHRPRISSTLRSTHATGDLQTQTLYLITPEGLVQAHHRQVARPPSPPPLHRRNWPATLTRAALALAVALVLYQVINWRGLATQAGLIHRTPPSVTADAFAEFFTPAEVQTDAENQTTLILRRTPLLATTRPIAQWPAQSYEAQPLSRRLAIEAIARGTARAQCFDSRGALLATQSLAISGIDTQPEVRALFKAPVGTVRIVLAY